MRIRIRDASGYQHWSLAAAPGATVGSLASAVGLPRAGYYALGGVVTPAESLLAEATVQPGALLEPIATVPEPAAIAITVVDGPDAGRHALLAPGVHLLGRHPSSRLILTDPTIGAAHLDISVSGDGSVTVSDRSPDGATWVGGQPITHPTTIGPRGNVVIGETTVRFEMVEMSVSPIGEIHTRRATPRHRAPRVPTPINLDAPTRDTERATPPAAMASVRSLVSMVVPTAAGALLACLLRPELAVFAVLGPVGALVTWVILRLGDVRAARRYFAAQDALDHAHQRVLVRHRLDCERTRRGAQPDIGELARLIRSLDPSLWQRCRDHADFAHLSVGPGRITDPATGLELHDVPVVIDAAESVGIVGDAALARSCARSLVLQLAALHGPADVQIAVFSDHLEHWQFTQWLPHCVASDGTNLVGSTTDAIHAACHAVANAGDAGAASTVVIVDTNPFPPRWREQLGALLSNAAARASVIMCAPTKAHLPQQCVAIATLHEGGGGTVTYSATSAAVGAFSQLSIEVADDLAAHLAPLRDGERRAGTGVLADQASLLALLTIDACEDPGELHARAVDAISGRWQVHRQSAEVIIPIGVGDDGPLHLDLVHDGPHGLLAGTTGSGKSELLRTLVLALAATADCEHVAMLLVDYKGGSAFDGVAELPQVVDVLTDLDPAVAARALRGLDAEIRQREEVLRQCRTGDIMAYHALRRLDPSHPPLPRLVIVVDEFATLASELPEFVDSLVDIAQRGRSLGVHLLLATQRPSGAVKDSIRTNTNLRIALRVLDGADSRDVLGVDDAARLPRQMRGRGLVRLGAGDVRRFQSAYVGMTTPALPQGSALVVSRVNATGPSGDGAPPEVDRRSDLDRLVAAIGDAHVRTGMAIAPRPWADPLPDVLELDRLDAAVGPHTAESAPHRTYLLGLGDRPDCRGHEPVVWDPRSGNVLFAGLAGRGTTTALATVVARAVGVSPLGPAWVFVIAATVAPYAALTKRGELGAVVAIDDRERLDRMINRLAAEVRRRRNADEASAIGSQVDPEVVVVIDGVGALRSSLDTLTGLELLDVIERIAVEGPAVGVHMAFATEHPGTLGHRLERTVGMTVLLDAEHPSSPPGRGTHHDTGVAVQLVHLAPADLASAIDSAITTIPAPNIGRLPDQLDAGALPPPHMVAGRLTLRIGIGETDLLPAGFDLAPGEQVFICGPARSGKSTMIRHLHATLTAAGIEPVLIAGPRSQSADAITSPDAVADALRRASHRPGAADPRCKHPLVVLVDDADAIDERCGIEQLAAGAYGEAVIIAAARGDRLRGLFRHWTTDLRRSGHAVLLRPDDSDADLVGVRLPRSFATQVPGRGWLVNDLVVQRCQFPSRSSG